MMTQRTHPRMALIKQRLEFDDGDKSMAKPGAYARTKGRLVLSVEQSDIKELVIPFKRYGLI